MSVPFPAEEQERERYTHWFQCARLVFTLMIIVCYCGGCGDQGGSSGDGSDLDRSVFLVPPGGGVFRTSRRVVVEIPNSVLADSARLQIGPIVADLGPSGYGLTLVPAPSGQAIEIRLDDLYSGQPVTLGGNVEVTLPFTIPSGQGFLESDLVVFHEWNSGAELVSNSDSTINSVSNAITFEVDRFSRLQVSVSNILCKRYVDKS